MSGDEILFERRGRAGLVTLNRPEALNALTSGMVHALHGQLREWAVDPDIARVVVRAAGDRAFCAGGDIRALHDWGRAGDPRILEFYRDEYRLDTFVKRFPKPYVSLIDGIVMGGGVGISVHGSHRLGTEATMFAMPETGIGLFPDVGGTYFLPRMPGRIGTWEALTGARLGQADALEAGVLTHAVARDERDAIVDALCVADDVDEALRPFQRSAGEPAVASHRDAIDRVFSHDTVEAIVEALAGEGEWGAETARTILSKSPTSLKIALRQMQVGAEASFEECMRIEFRIVSRVVEGHEFYEGVRAQIIDKDRDPHWDPPSLSGVGDAMVDSYFAPLPGGELQLD